MLHPPDDRSNTHFPEVPDHILAHYREDVQKMEQNHVSKEAIVENIISFAISDVMFDFGFQEVECKINHVPNVTIASKYQADKSYAIIQQSKYGNDRVVFVGLSLDPYQKPEDVIEKIRDKCAQCAIPAEFLFMLDGLVLAEDIPPQPPPTRYYEAGIEKEFPWFLSLNRGSYLITNDDRHFVYLYRQDSPSKKYFFVDAASQETIALDTEVFEDMCKNNQIHSMDEPMKVEEFLKKRFEETRQREEHFRTITTKAKTEFRKIGL